MSKPHLAALAAHLELMARGQGIIVRLAPELAPRNEDGNDDQRVSQAMTAAAARVIRVLAPYESELREWLKARLAKPKGA